MQLQKWCFKNVSQCRGEEFGTYLPYLDKSLKSQQHLETFGVYDHSINESTTLRQLSRHPTEQHQSCRLAAIVETWNGR
jgi:membrane protease subunit (stomatin/prohibitin family)